MTTGQPYVFTNDDPLNKTDPLGLCWFACGVWHDITKTADDTGHYVDEHRTLIVGIVAAGTCVAFSLGVCAAAVGAAFVARAQYRIERQGFSNSLGSNFSDLVITAGTFGLVRWPLAEADIKSFSGAQQILIKGLTGVPLRGSP
jgi:hypothetical protein